MPKPKAKPTAATLPIIAEALDLTTRRVTQLVAEGVLPKAARGAYDVEACLRAYVRYLQQALRSKAVEDESGELISSKGERSRLLKAQREREELELAKARGELMAIADHEAILSSMVQETKARITAVAPRASAELVAQTSRVMVHAILEKHLKQALSDLERTTPVNHREEAPAAEAKTPKPKAKAKPKPTPKAPKGKAKKTPKRTARARGSKA